MGKEETDGKKKTPEKSVGNEQWTTTRKTRMLYMEEVSQASNMTSSGTSSEKEKKEEPSEGGGKETKASGEPENARGSPLLSPKPCASSLRRRSQGSGSPVRKEEEAPAPPADEKVESSKDVEKAETSDKVDQLNLTFKKTATAISKAIVASRPIKNNEPGPRRPPFKKMASNLGKASLGLKGFGKSFHHNDELDSLTETMLYGILKYLFWAMKVSGIFFVRPKGAALFQMSSARCLKSVSLAQIYCLVILLILSVNLIRSFWAFSADDGFGYMLFFKMIWTILWYDSASRCLFFNIMWYKKKNGLQAFFISIEKICYSDGIIPYESSLKQTLKQVAITMTIFGTLAFASFVYGFFGTGFLRIEDLFNSVLAPVPSE